MDEGIGLRVDDLHAPGLVRVDDRDLTLVVGGDDHLVFAIPIDIGDLDVPQPVEAAPEGGIPMSLLRPRSVGEAPGLEHGLVGTDRQDRISVDHRFVEDVAVGVLDDRRLPAVGCRADDQELGGAGNRATIGTTDELRLGDEQGGVGPSLEWFEPGGREFGRCRGGLRGLLGRGFGSGFVLAGGQSYEDAAESERSHEKRRGHPLRKPCEATRGKQTRFVLGRSLRLRPVRRRIG